MTIVLSLLLNLMKTNSMDLSTRVTKKIIDLNIDLITYKAAIEKIIELGKNKTASFVCFANAHMTIEAYEDKNFSHQVNNASLVLADGVPLVKALKLFYGVHQERVAGMDAMPDLIRVSNDHKLKILFFGTTPQILEKIRKRILKEFPSLKIVGLISPPFNEPLNDESYIDIINMSGANLVFVALGCPKQEKWMAKNSNKIKAVLLGVGGAFPVYARISARAPYWMQKLGFEWLFRLCQEPSRLLKRYLTTNSKFIFLILQFALKRGKQRTSSVF